MRITDAQRRTILHEINAVLGASVRAWLFGSRTNDTTRGGDVDLYLESGVPIPPLLKARLVARLERRLANHVDLVIREPGSADTPIFRIARQSGVSLDTLTEQS